MTDISRHMEAIAATWPPAREVRAGPFIVGVGEGGGNRVSAARLADAGSDDAGITEASIAETETAQRLAQQSPLFMIAGGQTHLDTKLDQMGYAKRDATDILISPVDDIAEAPPPVTCFEVWPPLAAQEEIWDAGGIGPARLAIMHRPVGAKTSIFGRIADRPAGTAFVACHGDIAMMHALEVSTATRRKGLARIMVRSAAAWAAEAGARHFIVLVTQANTAAQALYASLGLTPAGQYHYRAR